jgi:ribosome-binding protein aMBF1 (putative translation factor)
MTQHTPAIADTSERSDLARDEQPKGPNPMTEEEKVVEPSRALARRVEERIVLFRMAQGSWWASHKLAIELQKPQPEVIRALRRLQRRGRVTTAGQLWTATDAGRAALEQSQ